MRVVSLFFVPWLLCACGDADVPVLPPPDAGTAEPESCWVPPQAEPVSIAAVPPLTAYVDPFIGTGGIGFGTGSAFPGPQTPFGMARPGPDTMLSSEPVNFMHCSGYAFEDTYVYGFSQTRMHGTGIVDYGTVGVMPTLGMSADKTSELGRRAAIDKSSEEASPGFYRARIGDDIQVELTTTDRVALHRYTFPPSVEATVLIDIGHELPDVTIVDGSVEVDADEPLVTGFAHFSGGYSSRFGGMPVYFAARFDRPPSSRGVWQGAELAEGELSRAGGDVGAWFGFDTTTDPEVGVAIGISFVDVEHALANLAAESPTFDLDGARAAAEASWEQALSRVRIAAQSERDLEIAYTALYHTLLMPTLATESDGTYRGLDGEVHAAEGFVYYTDFSLWDTYRTLHPLLSLVYPERQLDMVRSMVAMAEQSGAPPKWVLGIGETGGMVGDSAAVVVADSWARGIRDFDLAAIYEVLRASGTTTLPTGGRDHVEEYDQQGYLSIESASSSGSKTLEYALDDFALAEIAAALGDTAEGERFRLRAKSWQNLWDAESGFLIGRHADGSFANADDPLSWQDYWAEGTTWHYTWFAPHDIAGLAEVMGGKDAFLARLDEFFATSSCQKTDKLLPKPYYWHSNEPVLFVPWAYAELDEAGRTAKWVRWALANEYGDGPDGLPGNDDGGTMSAWWLWSASGIFPRIGTSEYLIGAPSLPEVTLALPGGDLVIVAEGPLHGYPVGATLDGQRLPRPRFGHADIASGGTLIIELAAEPRAWN